MILDCNYEEITALTHGARSYLDEPSGAGSAVVAPSASRAAVESLLGRLRDDLSVRTLAEQRELQRGIQAVVGHLRATMDAEVMATHPAAEEAVAAYFDFAHALSVLGRVRLMGEEMSALVEVMTGAPPDEESVRSFIFPD